MAKKITCGGITVPYEADNYYGFENMHPNYQDVLLYDDYDYDKETFLTASSFDKPTRAIVLEKRYRDKILRDPNTLMSMYLGTGFHLLAEKAARQLFGKRHIIESRFAAKVCGKKVTAKADLVFEEDGKWVVCDYKTTKTGSMYFQQPSHVLQLSINRTLCNIERELPMANHGLIFKAFSEHYFRQPDLTIRR